MAWEGEKECRPASLHSIGRLEAPETANSHRLLPAYGLQWFGLMKPAPLLESDKVNWTIQQGLAHCRHCPVPVVALAEFLDELRRDPSWDPSSIWVVEATIRHMLAQIVSPEASQPPED